MIVMEIRMSFNAILSFTERRFFIAAQHGNVLELKKVQNSIDQYIYCLLLHYMILFLKGNRKWNRCECQASVGLDSPAGGRYQWQSRSCAVSPSTGCRYKRGWWFRQCVQDCHGEENASIGRLVPLFFLIFLENKNLLKSIECLEFPVLFYFSSGILNTIYYIHTWVSSNFSLEKM